MLNIDVLYVKGLLIIRLDGVLNKTTSYVLKDLVDNTVCKAGIKNVAFNIEKLNFIDLYGLNEINNTYKKTNKGKIILTGYMYNDLYKNIDKFLKKYILKTDTEINALKMINI